MITVIFIFLWYTKVHVFHLFKEEYLVLVQRVLGFFFSYSSIMDYAESCLLKLQTCY